MLSRVIVFDFDLFETPVAGGTSPRLASGRRSKTGAEVSSSTGNWIRALGAGLAAAAGGWLLLRWLPWLELRIFAGGAARLAGLFTGSPVLRTDQSWELPSASVPVAVTAACSAADFFLIVAALIGWQLAKRGKPLVVAIPAGLIAALPLTIPINALRIIAVAQAHRWIIPLLPEAYGPILHMLTGVAVFLPSLVALNWLLEYHRRICRLTVAQVAWASRPCAMARVHGQDPAFAGGFLLRQDYRGRDGGQVARATLLASSARARRHHQSGDAPQHHGLHHPSPNP